MNDRQPFALAPLTGLRPVGGASPGSHPPPTVISWKSGTLVVADRLTGRWVGLVPAFLYHYQWEQTLLDSHGRKKQQEINGLAVLDGDGLVLLDLPGLWSAQQVAAFATARGIPVVSALDEPSEVVRTVLASRAPGGRRLGELRPRTSRIGKIGILPPAAGGLAVSAGLAVTVSGWQSLSVPGRLLTGIGLPLLLTPLLIGMPLAYRAVRKRRAGRGGILSRSDGLRLSVKRGGQVSVSLGPSAFPGAVGIGPEQGAATGLLIYRHEDLSGLFLIGRNGLPVRHFPGIWPLEDGHRFAVRHGLGFLHRSLTRAEYLDLVRHTDDAYP